jgi:hypothetical protein
MNQITSIEHYNEQSDKKIRVSEFHRAEQLISVLLFENVKNKIIFKHFSWLM